VLDPRWTKLRPHPTQQQYLNSPHRFNTLPCGRRSGKTELAKRKVVKRALSATTPWTPRYFTGAPTRDQAKRIYWDDLKALCRGITDGRPSETELMVRLINGAEIYVVGLDKPERIEGQPWDGGVLDEYANMKPHAWSANIRPALSDRTGWCDLIGVPEGRNHYYELHIKAQALMQQHGDASEWGAFQWISADILPASEIEAAKRDLDELTYKQEYEASFVNFEGRAYYPFDRSTHTAQLPYNPRAPLIFCFDFNVEPGTAAVCQEMTLPGQFERDPQGILLLNRPITGTGVIGEVWIPRNSNTPAVCRKLIEVWGKHEGPVRCYGDASGGARGSAKVQGSDWDLIKAELRPTFGDRLSFKVPNANPPERSRVNAVNTRLQAGDGVIRLMVDPSKAPHVVKDLEGVTTLKGGSGELDKKADAQLTHISDGLGYYVVTEFPIVSRNATVTPLRM
jgi:hypothetical protein